MALGVVAVLYGTWAFLSHGHGRITALGLFNFAFALFVGVGGISEGLDPLARTSAGYVSAAITLALVVQLLVNQASWRKASSAEAETPGTPPIQGARLITRLGAAGIVAVFIAQRAGLPFADLGVVDAAVFASVTLFAAGLIFREDTELASRRVLYALGAFVLYATVFHQGTGRLRLVALACVLGLLLTARFPYRGIKWAAVAVTPLAVWWLAQDRLDYQESLNPGASEGRTGLESMLSPIRLFGQIIEAIDVSALTPSWGTTFLSVPFAVVPEQLQPDWVPPALGYQLVALVDAGRLGSGYSVVGTVYGEWYWNFGSLGLLLAVPVLSWLFIAVDSRFRRSLTDLASKPYALVSLVFWAMLAGGIADLAWSGTHTWAVRQLSRLPLLILLIAILWFTNRPVRQPQLWNRDPKLLPSALRDRLAGEAHADASCGRARVRRGHPRLSPADTPHPRPVASPAASPRS
ncbi:oligosaccharide repeat unit polymerase [Blastococcus aggregatus]|uniref:oligosaccharide repeat unit polymerase n=1 Tax=Blastococcus aggregatus TaxID=38502 RepID=UPI001144AAC2|nr:oligosaccharide repeat unit polymerase [Blastococcus aggregatus]